VGILGWKVVAVDVARMVERTARRGDETNIVDDWAILSSR
jgi:hypothetical protein